MLITLDVGNTTISWILHDQQVIVKRGTFPTDAASLADLFGAIDEPEHVTGIFTASVVPNLDPFLSALCRKVFGVEPEFMDHLHAGGMSFNVDNPSELGADRIAACMGALQLFSPPLIVLDSGTATTYDLIDQFRVYQGGAIAPGLGLQLKCLAQNTAKLMDVEFAVPGKEMGKNTQDHIQLGVYHQYIGGMEHTIRHFQKVMGEGVKVVACGGTLGRLPALPEGIDHHVADLIHIGLSAWAQQDR